MESTDFFEYVNALSGTPFLQFQSFSKIRNNQNMALAQQNKQNMMIVSPDDMNNPDFNLVSSYGVQICAFNFFNKNSKLQYAIQQFQTKRTAFILKPASLRYIPVTIPTPPVSAPELSYQQREIRSDFYSFKI